METWDLYDINRQKLGKTHTRGVPMPKGCYHLVVHIWLQNDKGELLLSKRHPKKHYGNLWECTGGSVLAGEDSLEGAIREVEEELGLKLDAENGKFLYHEVRETHHSDNWLFISNCGIDELTLQADEVIAAKWVNKITYEKMIQNREVVPTLKHFYHYLLNKSNEEYFLR